MLPCLKEDTTVLNMKKIEDEKYVLNLFRNLARLKIASVSVRYRTKEYSAKISFGDKRGEDITIIPENNHANFRCGDEIEISLFNKDLFILFNAVVGMPIAEGYRISKPSTVFSSSRRMVSRHRIDESEGVYVCFTESGYIFKLIDISTRGLSFKSNSKFLDEDKGVYNIIIKIPDVCEIAVEGCVRYCIPDSQGFFTYGLSFNELEWNAYHKLFTFIFKKSYPFLKPIYEFPPEKIHNLYEESGYLALKTKDEMDRNFSNMIKNLYVIGNKSQICNNSVYYNEDKLMAGASLLRIYDRTFLGHQLASVPEARLNPRTRFDIYFEFADFMLNHPYGEFHLAYFDANLTWHHEMYRRISNIIGDKTKFIYDNIQFFEFNADKFIGNPYITNQYKCLLMDKPDDFIKYCEQYLQHLEVQSYSYNTQESFKLTEIKQIYEALGLYVCRKLWCVYDGYKPVAYVVAEAFTDGLNLFNLVDMCRVYMVNYDVDMNGLLLNILKPISAFFKNYGKKKYNVLFKADNEVARAITIPGMGQPVLAGRVIANREGVFEYKKLLTINCR